MKVVIMAAVNTGSRLNLSSCPSALRIHLEMKCERHSLLLSLPNPQTTQHIQMQRVTLSPVLLASLYPSYSESTLQFASRLIQQAKNPYCVFFMHANFHKKVTWMDEKDGVILFSFRIRF